MCFVFAALPENESRTRLYRRSSMGLPGKFSPDGRWFAYASNESNRNEVLRDSLSGASGRWQISTAGGTGPRWSHDGAEIFYLAPDNKLMAATVNGWGASFEAGAVKPLFEIRAGGGRVSYSYDVSADGQHFLINTAPEQEASSPSRSSSTGPQG